MHSPGGVEPTPLYSFRRLHLTLKVPLVLSFATHPTLILTNHRPRRSQISAHPLKRISSDFICTTCAPFDKEILATTEDTTQFLIINFKTPVLEMA